jgi:choline kinase
MKTDYKVVITASGTGSRLGEVTQFLNKGIVRVGKKAAISYILDNIPIGTPVVITLGYKKEQVVEYLTFAHPERTFEFVDVDRYEGQGSSLGYSLLCASKHLQTPFIFVACDTLFSMPLELPQNNWMGVAKVSDAKQYTSIDVGLSGQVQAIHTKSAAKFDYAYIGLAGVHDYATFWDNLSARYVKDPFDSSLNDTVIFTQMIQEGLSFQYRVIEDWLDIGNEEGLKKARQEIGDTFDNLEKLDESIYLLNNQFVLKFFHDSSVIKKRAARARLLGSIVPQVDKVGENFYRYQYVDGDLYSRVVDPQNLRLFLDWCQQHLWSPATLGAGEEEKFRLHCRRFYYEKSKQRLSQFFYQTGLSDKAHVINHQAVPSIAEMFSSVDWNRLFEGVPSRMHGDLHFENVIKIDDRFCLLDWRQDFDGLIEYGDIYYDLAKLNHGMIVSHESVRKNLFRVEMKEDNIHVDISRPDNLALCQDEFYRFLKMNSFDIYKIEVLTALIFLNIAPLHHHPYNLFLHFLGKSRLWSAITPLTQPLEISCPQTALSM